MFHLSSSSIKHDRIYLTLIITLGAHSLLYLLKLFALVTQFKDRAAGFCRFSVLSSVLHRDQIEYNSIFDQSPVILTSAKWVIINQRNLQ